MEVEKVEMVKQHRNSRLMTDIAESLSGMTGGGRLSGRHSAVTGWGW